MPFNDLITMELMLEHPGMCTHARLKLTYIYKRTAVQFIQMLEC